LPFLRRPFEVQGEEFLEDLFVGEVRGPVVGGEDGFVELRVRVREPGRAFVVELCNTNGN
jgi:hypothetical protein